MDVIAHRPTWYVLVCPECGRQRDLFCHDHADPVKVKAVEVMPASQLRGAVEALRKLAAIHHDTITPSKLHNPHNRDWTECECKSCRLAQSFGGQ